MRYTTAVAVASLATGAFAAGHGHAARHQRHAREAEAEAEPEPTNYTYSAGQCWGTYGCESNTGNAGAAQQTAAPAATSVVAQAAAAPTQAKAANPVQSVASKATSAAKAVASSGSSSSGGSINVASIIKSVSGMLTASSDGTVVEGSSNKNVMEITNDSGEGIVWTCWGSAGSWVNKFAPIMALGIADGDTKTISFKDTPAGAQGGGCAPVLPDTILTMGQITNTWLESTFNQYGTVDVSREVMITGGHSITAKAASGCTTSMTQCVFKCNDKNGAANTPNQCGEAGSYSLQNCSGPGANSAVTDGGCMFGDGKMTVTVGGKVNSY